MAVLPDEEDKQLTAPPAPAVAALRNVTGVAAQDNGSLTQVALDKQQDAAQTVASNYTPPVDSPTAQSQQQEASRSTTSQPQTAGNTTSTAPPPKPAAPTGPTQRPYAPQNDPRDANYWANKQALESSFYAAQASVLRQQSEDDVETNLYGMELAEYNRRRKRNMGESRLGTGSAYTGAARRDQLENDTDFMFDATRRQRQKASRDMERQDEIGRLRSQRDRDIRELETATARQMGDDMVKESATGAGDAEIGPKSYPEKGKNTSAQQARIRKRMENQTKRIKAIREQIKKTRNPAKKEKLQKQVQRIRKKRTNLQGRLGKITTKD
jgi:hypothetical protein